MIGFSINEPFPYEGQTKMNKTLANFLRFAGIGRKAKDLNDEEIVELYKRVKEGLQEHNGEPNPVLDSDSPGDTPMGDDSEFDFGTDPLAEGEPSPDSEGAPVEDTPTPTETEPTGLTPDTPALEQPTEGTPQIIEEGEKAPESDGDAYDPEQDKELQDLLNEMGLGDDEEPAKDEAIGETGDGSDASGAPGVIPNKGTPPKEDEVGASLQVNSSEEPEELSMDELKVMFGVAPKKEEEAPVEQTAAVEPSKEEPIKEEDEFAVFFNTFAPKEGEDDGVPKVEEKEAAVAEPLEQTIDAPAETPIVEEEPLNDIADQFEVLGVEQAPSDEASIVQESMEGVKPVVEKEAEEVPVKNETVIPANKDSVDISDFTVAGKGRIAGRGFQTVRKDKDTMADGITKKDADAGIGLRGPRSDLKNPWGADYKKNSENRDTDCDSDKDLKIASIIKQVIQ